MAVETLLKQPAEARRHPIVLRGLVLVEVVSVTVEPRGRVPGALALDVTAEIAAGLAVAELTGGSDGEDYLVTIRVLTDAGELVEAELDVSVMDMAWAMPDGGAPYLSIAEFVERFGLPEVIAMTDGIGDGRIDRHMLVARLVDAQAVVDAHVASRYAVPLAEVPLIVKKWVADLARAALYPNGAPEGVADQAKATLRMLERVQAGLATLPASAPPAEAASDTPVLIAPGYRAYPDGLKGYR